MSEPKWDKKRLPTRKRLSGPEIKAVAEYYEAGLKTGRTSEELLQELEERCHKSTRQIQRYIEKERRLGGTLAELWEEHPRQPEEQAPSKPETHYEDVRKAIGDWLALMREPEPLFNPAAAVEPAHFGFGLTWQVGPEGISAKLVVEDKQSYPLLSTHLAPPIVDADFWSQVQSLKEAGTDFLSAGLEFGQQIAKVSQVETGLATVTSWQRDPKVGITPEFGVLISRNALGVQQCTSYAYFELAIVYLDRGIMVTQIGEGVSLLQGAGLDPTLTTAYVSTAGAWVIPQGNQRLICDEAVEASKPVVRAIHFVLHLHGYVIAIGSLEQIRHCRDVHERLMQKYAGSPDAMAVRKLRQELELTSKATSSQLEKASLHHYFPGRCPFCP